MTLDTSPSLLQGAWRVDRTRSGVGFLIRHMGVATVGGRFTSFAGRIDGDGTRVRVDGHVDAASVDTGERIRDGRLRSEFFDAERFPAIVFHADVAVPEPGRAWRLEGELTIRDVMRPVTLRVTPGAPGNGTIHLRAAGTIRRSDFGLDWPALRRAGRLLVADHLRLSADVVLDPA